MPSFADTQQMSGSACDRTVREKESLISKQVEAILSELRGAFWIMSVYEDKVADIPHIYSYLRSVQENHFGDMAVHRLMDLIIGHSRDSKAWTTSANIGDKKPKGKPTAFKKRQYKMRADPSVEPHGLSLESRVADLKLRADYLTHFTAELTGWIRARRFFMGIKSCLASREITCAACGGYSKDYSTMLLMGRCGHAVCKQCFNALQTSGTSPDKCLDRTCGSNSPPSSAIDASDLTDSLRSKLAQEHGSKMAAIMELLSRIPRSEKVLIFVQFSRIMTALKTVLTACSIKFADTTDSKKAADEVARFMKKSAYRICLLELDSPNAAGW